MTKLNILQSLLTTIKGPKTVPDGALNSGSEQSNNGTVITKDDLAEEELIKQLSRAFAQVLNDRDYEHLDGRAEYYFYTIDHLIELIKNDDEQSTVNLITENKIKSKFEDCEFISITFSNNSEQAKVIYNVKTSMISAEDKYFKELNKKSNKKEIIGEGTPFSTTYTLSVKKDRGVWRIDKFETSKELKID